MMVLAAVLGADRRGTAGTSVMNSCQLLLLRAWQAPRISETENEELASALRQLAVLLDPGNQWNIYTAANLNSARMFFDMLERIVPNLQAYPNPNVRAAAAHVLRLWNEQGSMPSGLNATFEQFKQDARARVRFETRFHEK